MSLKKKEVLCILFCVILAFAAVGAHVWFEAAPIVAGCACITLIVLLAFHSGECSFAQTFAKESYLLKIPMNGEKAFEAKIFLKFKDGRLVKVEPIKGSICEFSGGIVEKGRN
jgi:hypothetical protein